MALMLTAKRYLLNVGAPQDRALKHRGEVVAVHAGGGDGGELWPFERRGFDRRSHPSRDWLLRAAIKPLEEAQRSLGGSELDHVRLHYDDVFGISYANFSEQLFYSSVILDDDHFCAAVIPIRINPVKK
jgi:hypothetical protein